MSSSKVISVKNLGKKYCRNLKQSMLYGIQDILIDSLNLSHKPTKLRKDEFWANRHISFEIERGKCLGVIGPNGSGKSTLLKLLNGIFYPDEGTISISGRICALIEIGAGFHPLLTGRENIYLNASILGYTRHEVDTLFDEIVDFAGIEKYLDMPVKNYSSGMYARLGFSIAAHTKPDIFLIDEILAVGDISFRSKCFEKINSLRSDGTCFLFVSHELSLIDKISDEVLLLRPDAPPVIGSPTEAIESYRNQLLSEKTPDNIHNHPALSISQVKIRGINNEEPKPGSPLNIEITYTCSETIQGYKSVSFHLGYGDQIAACRADRDEHGLSGFTPPGGIFRLSIPANPFSPGFYSISIRIFDKDHITPLVEHYVAYPFIIRGNCDVVGHVHLNYTWGD